MKITDNTISIPFVKMSGAGNDFVLIDDGNLPVPVENCSQLSKILCDRHRGAGADGLLVYRHRDDIDFEMDYYNADGSTGGMCGNGGRCIAAYHFDMYGVDQKSVKFIAFGSVYSAIRKDDVISVEMKDPTHILTDLSVNIDGVDIGCHFIDTGSPHVVVFPEELKKFYPDAGFDTFDIRHLGRRIRKHEAFRPLGTNVNFIQPLESGDISIRTYERGVENETLACGTGSIASAIITAIRFNKETPINVHTRSGEVLVVTFTIDKERYQISDVILAGPCTYVFTGTAYIDTGLQTAGTNTLPKNEFRNTGSITIR